MNIEILAFGQVAEAIGKDRIMVENIYDSRELKKYLEKNYPAIKQVAYSMVIEHKLSNNDSSWSAPVEIALLPPFSGG